MPHRHTSREPNGHTLDFYLARGGYEGAAQGARPRRPARSSSGEGLRAARPRRRRLPDRDEVAVRAEGLAQAEVPLLQRRRERAGHVQGPRADGAQPAPALRGVPDRVPRHRREGRLHLHPRRVPPRAAGARGRDRGGARGGVSREEHPRDGLRLRDLRAPGAGAYEAGEESGAARVARGQARAAAPASRRSRPSSASTAARRPSTTSRRSATCRSIIDEGPGVVRGARAREERRAEALLRQRPRREAGRLRGVDERHAARADLRLRRRHSRRPGAEGDHPGRVVDAGHPARPDRRAGELRRPGEGGLDARVGGHHRDGRHDLHGLGRARTCCTSTATSRAGSARRAARAPTGC